MVNFVLRPFFGFNALEVDCSSCKHPSSLNCDACLECVNKLGLGFDLLELRKSFSTVYYEKGLSSSLLNDKFHLSKPLIAPLFLNFYVLPLVNGRVLSEEEEYKIVSADSSNIIGLNPLEYNLSIDDLRLLSELVRMVQEEDVSLSALSSNIPKGKEFLKPLVERYTRGLGVVEHLLNIPGIQDVYINSPGNSCLFFNHGIHGHLSSNIFLKHEMINKIGTFLRSRSGRPFDEAFPVLHTDIKGSASRVCSITNPLSFEGSGFAIRKHAFNPFTLHRLVHDGFLSCEVAGLLWFLIDAEVSILITGPRGSGKTTLLGALLFEVNKNNRFIVIEDTKELPVEFMKGSGFNVEHLRTNSFEDGEGFEFGSDTALRTALRLGESVLVIGEVRGSEAKTLFEAMRIGASGNIVMGTIHGSSAFDTFDRIVNDLKVPPTSFKATDVVISCSYLKKGSKKERKLVSVTEVGKEWFRNPAEEKGFFELVCFNPKKGKYEFKALSSSKLLKRVAYNHGWSVRKCLSNIKLRSEVFRIITGLVKKSNNTNLLNPDSVIKQNLLFSALNNKYNNKLLLNRFHSRVEEFAELGGELKPEFKDNIIINALFKLGAVNRIKAVSSKELFSSSGTKLSRSSFNKLLAGLESEGAVKDDGGRNWYLSRRMFKFLKP